MGTEKYLGNKRLCFDMDEGDSLDYKVSSGVGNSLFDLYVGLIVQNGENKKYKSDDAGNTEIKRMNDFLKNHAGLTYQEFVDQSTPENLDTDSYKLLNRGSIKRSLFETRSKVYLLALCDYEEQGGDICSSNEQCSGYGDSSASDTKSGEVCCTGGSCLPIQ